MLHSSAALIAQAPTPVLVWKSAPPAWGTFLLITGIFLFTSWVYSRENATLSTPMRFLLGSLRLASLILMLLVFFNPVYEVRTDRKRKKAVVVLIDQSLSMAIKDRYTEEQRELLKAAIYPELVKLPVGDASASASGEASSSPGATSSPTSPASEEPPGEPDGEGAEEPEPLPEQITRMELVNALLDKQRGKLAESLKARGEVEIYAFAKKLIPNVQPGRTVARGPETRIGEALEKVLDGTTDRRIQAVVILSDGQNNAGEVSVSDVGARFAARKIPIFTIGVGSPVRPKDLDLVQLRTREKVLVKDKVSFAVKHLFQGFKKGREAGLVLEDISSWVKTVGQGWQKRMVAGQPLPLDEPRSRVLQTRTVKLLEPGVEKEERFTHIFEAEGVYFIRAKLGPLKGEETLENNQMVVRVEVRDDRLKVLYVDGWPTWEYRALRSWLVRDPKIIAHIYLCSADTDFPQDKSPAAPELTDDWPITDPKKLAEDYHVIILGDINPNDLMTEHDPQASVKSKRFLEAVQRFVEKDGGGLVLLAGNRYMPKSFKTGPLSRLMPVKHVDDTSHASHIFKERQRIRQTPGGQGHPIFRLEDDPAANRQVLERDHVFTFYWYQKTRPVPGTSVLAVHPQDSYSVGGGGAGQAPKRKLYPIFALRNHGKGKVFFSATDETWRWRFLRGDMYFARFWGQVLRYVGAPKLFGTSPHYKLWTDRRAYEPLSRVEITLEVTDREFKPVADDSWKVNFRTPSGKEDAVFLSAIKGQRGTYKGALAAATERGRWELWVEKDPAKGIDEEARVFFNVRIPNLESKAPELDKKRLQELAQQTGGRYFESWEAQGVPPLIKVVKDTVGQAGNSKSAWDKDWILALVLTLLCAEWLLRKLCRLQ